MITVLPPYSELTVGEVFGEMSLLTGLAEAPRYQPYVLLFYTRLEKIV